MLQWLTAKPAAKIVLISLITSMTGCDRIQIGEPFTCRTDMKYFITSGLSFTIDSVSDYRCPKDVICIWGGDVDLSFVIRENLTATDTILRLSGGPYIFSDFSVEILRVEPLRNHDEVVDQEDYRIKLLIQKYEI